MKNLILLCSLLGGALWASQIQVSMFLISENNPGFFTFNINGTVENLLCDQFLPNATTERYTSSVATLNDLANTQLVRNGDPAALLKYEQVAILDLQAYSDPTLAADVVRAARIIVDGNGPNTPGSQRLLDFVQSQNPAKFDLSGFMIFTSPLLANGDPLTQEMTGFPPAGGGITGSQVPEPSSAVLLPIGSFIVFGFTMLCGRRRRC